MEEDDGGRRRTDKAGGGRRRTKKFGGGQRKTEKVEKTAEAREDGESRRNRKRLERGEEAG